MRALQDGERGCDGRLSLAPHGYAPGMADCPNCGADVPDGERLCPSCGFDTEESQADRVRELRDEGKIHPGRLNDPEQPGSDIGGAVERGHPEPSPEGDPADPRETQGGL